MVSEINPRHQVFQSEAYRRDIVAFNLIEAIRYKGGHMLGDGESYIITISKNPSIPCWVWTADGICGDKLREMYECFLNCLPSKGEAFFVAKPGTADYISERLTAAEEGIKLNIRSMTSYECTRPVSKECAGAKIEKPVYDDLDTLAAFCSGFARECFERDMTLEEGLGEAKAFIEGKRAFVIRANGILAAMARGSMESEEYVSVNGVYTCDSYRGRGYAAALAAYIAGIILAEGKTAMLYADIDNPASNRAYMNAGFLPRGRVDEVKAVWEYNGG